jgi:hypothetical protein
MPSALPGKYRTHRVRYRLRHPEGILGIFDPLYHKEKGKGIVLGLASVYGIVKITGIYAVQSEEGRGHLPSISLPPANSFRG